MHIWNFIFISRRCAGFLLLYFRSPLFYTYNASITTFAEHLHAQPLKALSLKYQTKKLLRR